MTKRKGRAVGGAQQRLLAQHHLVHGRDAGRVSAALALDGADHLARDRRHAGSPPSRHTRAWRTAPEHAVGMEHRHREEASLVGPVEQGAAQIAGRPVDRAMRQHHALGQSGRARGVGDKGQVVGRPVRHQAPVGLSRQPVVVGVRAGEPLSMTRHAAAPAPPWRAAPPPGEIGGSEKHLGGCESA